MSRLIARRRLGVRILASVALLGSLASPAAAQSIDEIVTRHMAARGGSERWAAIRSLRMSGRARAGPGREALVTREIKRPGRVRTEFTFQGLTGVYAYDGKRGWQVSPLTGVLDPQALEPENAQVAAEQADLEGALAGGAQKGYPLALIGRETIAGREALHIRVTPKTGPPQEHYLDAETYLLVKTETTRQVRGRTVLVETVYGDYRSVGGALFPHSIDIGGRGRPERVHIVVESVDVNPPIDDKRFRMP